MNNKAKIYFFNSAWIAVLICVSVFLVTAVCVYAKAAPSGVTDLLTYDESWYSVSELSNMSGDLEDFSYVTKVYDYATDNDSVSVRWVNDGSVYRDRIDYGIVSDETAEHNYRVECFVYSNIADKKLVKRTWGVSVTEGDILTLVESEVPYCIAEDFEIGDIKKGSYVKTQTERLRYRTFIRITASPDFDNVKIDVENTKG